MKRTSLAFLVLLGLGILSCRREAPVPLPTGYFRIDLPEKRYLPFDTNYPYAFEYASVARLVPRDQYDSTRYWLNITYPQFKGTLHLSYKEVNDNLPTLLDDAIDLANKHIPKATSMEPTLILRDSARVFGLVYDIRGSGVASTVQFYLTDSVRHYVRGALYFYVIPNNDSLAPVIDYIHEDVDHLIESFRWK